jgi:hypothetical protein
MPSDEYPIWLLLLLYIPLTATNLLLPYAISRISLLNGLFAAVIQIVSVGFEPLPIGTGEILVPFSRMISPVIDVIFVPLNVTIMCGAT